MRFEDFIHDFVVVTAPQAQVVDMVQVFCACHWQPVWVHPSEAGMPYLCFKRKELPCAVNKISSGV